MALLLAAVGSLLWTEPARAEAVSLRPRSLAGRSDLSLYPPRAGSGLPLHFVPAITATKVYTLAVDDDGDNQADPGDVVSYTIVIGNEGTTTATGLTVSDTLDANTTLSGLIQVSPIAIDDSYNAAANPITLNVPDGVTDLFANDYRGLNPAVSGITSFGGGSLPGTASTTPAGNTALGANGSVTVNANGSFSFSPAVSFQGVFSFYYRLQNAVGPADGLVQITVDAPPTVTGTNPTNGATDVDATSDIRLDFSEAVNIAAGGLTVECPVGTPIAFTPALPQLGINTITLNPTTNLDGNDDGNEGDNYVFTFDVAATATDDSYNVTPHLTLTAPTSVRANDEPATVTITGFGPSLATANGTVPNGTNFITAGGAGGRVVLNADGTFNYYPDAGDTNTTATFFYTISGGDTAQVTLTLQNTQLVWFVDDNATGTTCTGSNAGTQACPLTTLAGAATVDTASDTIYLASGAYTCGITLAASERLLGDGSSSDLATITGISPVSGSGFPTFSGTDPTLSSGAGVNCLTLATNNTIRGLTIGNSGGAGGNASDISGTNFGTLTVLETTLTGTGQALNLDTGTLTATFDGVTSTNGTNNVNLVSVDGTANLGGGALSGASGDAFIVSGGTGNFTYAGSIANTTARVANISTKTGGSVTLSGNLTCNTACTGINAANNAGGTTVTFSGSTKTLTTGTTAAVTLSSNTGATITFSNGGLDIDTTSAVGFNATGGGTVNVTTGVNPNTINSTTGTALNVANTTIGASGLTFRSIAANGATNGIVLNTTGSNGGLTVTGDGTAASNDSGGTIQNTTGVAILLTNASNVSINQMRVQNGLAEGIVGSTVNGLILNRSNITTNGNLLSTGVTFADGEGNMEFTNLSGTVNFTNNTINNGFDNNVVIRNDAATTLNFTLTGNTISNAQGNQADGLHLLLVGNTNATLTANNNTFNTNIGDHMDLRIEQNAIFGVTITSNIFNGDPAIVAGGGILVAGIGDVSFPATFEGSITYNISNNNFQNANVTPISVNLSPLYFSPATGFVQGGGDATGTIANNVIGSPTVPRSGSFGGGGISVDSRGNASSIHTVLIQNNQVYQWSNGNAILMTVGETNSASQLNATIVSNTVANGSTFATNGIHLNSGTTSSSADVVCLDMGGAGPLANSIVGAGFSGSDDFRLRQRQSTTVRIRGYTGVNNDNTAVVNYVSSNNGGASGSVVNSVPTGGGFVNTVGPGNACPQP